MNSYPDPQRYYREIAKALRQPNYSFEAFKHLEKSDLCLGASILAQPAGTAYNSPLMTSVVEKKNAMRAKIQELRNVERRQEVKEAYQTLADFLLLHGDLNEAIQTYYRTHENNAKLYVLDYAVNWAIAMVWTQNFAYFKTINIIPSNDYKRSEWQEYQKWLLVSAIKCFILLDFTGFLNFFTKIQADLLPSISFITNFHDLGRYLAISCFVCKSPRELIEMTQNPFVIQILDQEPFVQEAFNCCIDYDFVQLITMTKKIVNDLSNDIHTQEKLAQIEQQVLKFLLKSYITNYKKLSLESLSKLLGTNIENVIDNLSSLILQEKLNFAIDPIGLTIQQRNSEEQMRYETYKELSNKVLNTIDEKYIRILKMKKVHDPIMRQGYI